MRFKTLSASLAAAALTASAFSSSANAEEFGGVDVSASVGVANMYLWRGFDVGNGDAAVFGDITASVGGFYGQVWTSSGDATAGQEYDLIVGYGHEFGDFSVGLSAISYVFPRFPIEPDPSIPNQGNDIGDWVEAALTLGWGPLSFTYFDTIEAKEGSYALGEDYSYFTASAGFGPFGILIGRHDMETGDDPVHLNLSYAYNDNLSFMVSKFVADEDEIEHDANFIVSYSIPLE
ncbi:histidine kinase [Proteobacteria bacterium 005FR1]|nr:histidine kinase [Proteobacteria bacterium 005FR1]